MLGRGSTGWAGAVGDAVYTTISVACGWAGAIMQKLLVKAKVLQTDRWMDGQTDQHGDL